MVVEVEQREEKVDGWLSGHNCESGEGAGGTDPSGHCRG